MDMMFSEEHHKLREILQDFANKASNVHASSASKDSPAPLIMFMQFESVQNIEEFEMELALRQQEQKVRKQREELEMRISRLNEQGIAPGQHYSSGEYITRFQYMLDIITLLGELGEIEQAVELANKVLALTNIVPPESGALELLATQTFLRAEAFWTLANTFAQDELFERSFEFFMELLDMMRKSNPDRAYLIQEDIGIRYLNMVDSGVDPVENLDAANVLLESLATISKLSLYGWAKYIQVLHKLGEYKKASKAVDNLLMQRKEEEKIAGISLHEIVSIRSLAELDTPSKFLNKLGPFSAPILAECKKICLSEAWQLIYQEPLTVSGKWQSTGVGILIDNVVVYEEAQDTVITNQVDIMMHEQVHLGVRSGQVYRSEGKWLKAYRDVPTAALLTYMLQIARSTRTQMPECLQFYVDLGRKSVVETPQEAHRYIEDMLGYFEMHGQETNASYQCAAIQAGMLLEIIGLSPNSEELTDSEEMFSYISHLEVLNHTDALEKARRKIHLEL